MAAPLWKAALIAVLLVAPALGAPQVHGGGVSVSYSTDSNGNTHESVQHLDAQQAQQLFLENQQKLQQLLAVNPFNFYNPWLLSPLAGFPFSPFSFPFLSALAYLPAALAANAHNILSTANQAALSDAARGKTLVDRVANQVKATIESAAAVVAAEDPRRAKK